ncbi:hypothetical protein G9A89_015265 [Geosiphon pyriformis]|nr:hypothetical protein G9A89_015265 [Geosiphon pyriformis]
MPSFLPHTLGIVLFVVATVTLLWGLISFRNHLSLRYFSSPSFPDSIKSTYRFEMTKAIENVSLIAFTQLEPDDLPESGYLYLMIPSEFFGMPVNMLPSSIQPLLKLKPSTIDLELISQHEIDYIMKMDLTRTNHPSIKFDQRAVTLQPLFFYQKRQAVLKELGVVWNFVRSPE